MMRRSLGLIAVLAWASPAFSGDVPPDLAGRAWAVTEAVLARHPDPPARQQMLLAGLRAFYKAGEIPTPRGLAARVSAIEAPGPFASILAEAWPRFAQGDREETPEEVLMAGLLSAVPGGAELLSAKALKVAEQMDGNLYVGIQVALNSGEGKGLPSFAQVLPGGPAEKAGAKAGDAIEAVDGVSIEGMPLAQVIDRLRGEEGTDVVVRLRRAGSAEPLVMRMTRGTLPHVSVQGLKARPGGGWDVRLDGPAGIGYLKVVEIVGSTPRELRALAAQLESEGARSLVLDLRQVNNAVFHPTVLLADALLDGGVIGRVAEADGDRVIRAEPDALFRDWPIVVLAGGVQRPEVAWLCAALEDNKRATMLGVRSTAPGGAFVRSAVPLPGGEWSVKMVTGRLERGNGMGLARPSDVARMPRPAGTPPLDAEDGPPDPYAAPKPPAQLREIINQFRGRPGAAGAQEDLLERARALLEGAPK